jgi:hypothetical protein
MQIIDRNGKVVIRLLQAEERRLRDAAYLAKRAAANLTDQPQLCEKLLVTHHALLELCALGTTGGNKDKLDKQDADLPER